MNAPRLPWDRALLPVVLVVLPMGVALLSGCAKGGNNPTAPGGNSGTAPVVGVSADSIRLIAGNSSTVRVNASDPSGDPLTFTYMAAGGTVASSGPTAQTAIFTGSGHGSAVVTVTATNTHGGHAAATARIFVLRTGEPTFTGIRYACGDQISALSESLLVTDGWGTSQHGYHGIDIGGHALPYILVPGHSYMIESSDPCDEALGSLNVVLQRPLPDGRGYLFNVFVF